MEKRDEENKGEVKRLNEKLSRFEEEYEKKGDKEEDSDEKGKENKRKKTGRNDQINRAKKEMEWLVENADRGRKAKNIVIKGLQYEESASRSKIQNWIINMWRWGLK